MKKEFLIGQKVKSINDDREFTIKKTYGEHVLVVFDPKEEKVWFPKGLFHQCHIITIENAIAL